jgi:hypothetical protein
MFDKNKFKILLSISIIFLPISQVLATSVIPDITQELSAITRTVTIQPIILSDNDGGNTASFFGSHDNQTRIEGFIDEIWKQAGIDINFLNTKAWNNTFANNGNNNPRPGSDLNKIVNNANTAGITNTNLDIINMFFVNRLAGFGSLGPNSAAGLAFVDGNGITQFVGSNLLNFTGGQSTIASVVAHEIGHNLGLFHTASGIDNLMSPNGTGNTLTKTQIDTVLNSHFAAEVTAVPVPAAVWMFVSGLLGLFSFSRKQSGQNEGDNLSIRWAAKA